MDNNILLTASEEGSQKFFRIQFRRRPLIPLVAFFFQVLVWVQYYTYTSHVGKENTSFGSEAFSQNVTLELFQLSGHLSSASVIIFLYSMDSNEENALRNIIRGTWLPRLEVRPEFRVLFIIGSNGRNLRDNQAVDEPEWRVSKEQKEHNDIVLVNHIESYDGLTEKMKKTYEWFATYQKDLFPHVEWYFKTDTDIYLYAEPFYNMYDDLKRTHLRRTMIGQVQKRAKVLREGPWGNNEFELDTYPPYVSGAGYWVTSDIVEWVGWNAGKGWLRSMPNEDTMVGIWMWGLKIQLLKDQRVHAEPGDHEAKMNRILTETCSPSYAVFHNLKPPGILAAHENVLDHGNPCDES
jgi:hypothetical protein